METQSGPIACLDVAYSAAASVAACALIDDWEAPTPISVHSFQILGSPADYEPGRFFLRELPLLLELLFSLKSQVSVAVVDGYVWLSGDGRAGLGAHLFDQLGGACPVIGVAKTRYRGDTWSNEVFRAASKRPLLVTSVGIDATQAAACIEKMHGKHRIPTLLKIADRLARDGLQCTDQRDSA